MPKFSDTVTAANFLLLVPAITEKVNDVLYDDRLRAGVILQDEQQTRIANSNSRLSQLATKFDSFAEDSVMSANAFKRGAEAARQLENDLLAACKKLNSDKDAWVEKTTSTGQVAQNMASSIGLMKKKKPEVTPQTIVKEFEESVMSAVQKHMSTIEGTYSIGDEVCAVIRPLLVDIVAGINALSEWLTGEKALPEIEGEYIPSSQITNEFKGKYDVLSQDLGAKDATENTPLKDDESNHNDDSGYGTGGSNPFKS